MGSETLAEIVRELLRRQVVDLVIETFACLPDGARVGVDGLRLQPFELQVLKVAFVIAFEICLNMCFHSDVASFRNVSNPRERGEVTF